MLISNNLPAVPLGGFVATQGVAPVEKPNSAPRDGPSPQSSAAQDTSNTSTNSAAARDAAPAQEQTPVQSSRDTEQTAAAPRERVVDASPQSVFEAKVAPTRDAPVGETPADELARARDAAERYREAAAAQFVVDRVAAPVSAPDFIQAGAPVAAAEQGGANPMDRSSEGDTPKLDKAA